jgi:large repetitive protein
VKIRKLPLLSLVIFAIAPVAFAGTPIFDVAVTKSGPSTINRGADITYTVTVSNPGNTPATTVQMTDPLPPGITFVSLAQSGPVFACSTPAAGANGTISCSIATLAVGASTTFTIVGSVPGSATGGSTFANTATVTTTSADSNNTNNSQTSTATVNALADLSVTKTAPGTATAGSDVSFSIQVMNNGLDAAATVSLTDPLPAGMTFVSETQNSGPAFSCSNPSAGTNGTITCTIASMPAGSIADFTFVANIPPQTPPGTTFNNTATVSTATFDPNDENNVSTGSTTVPAPSADLRVQKNGPVSALPNSDVAYSITVINAGPDPAANVALTDTLPGTMTFVSIAQNSGPAFDCTSQPAVGSGGTVTCTIATLAANTTSTFTLTGHMPSGTPAGTTFTNVANVATSTSDPNPINNQSPTTLTVGNSDLAITKTGPATATAGGTIAWTITVTNNGPDTEPNASFSDTLPAGTTFNSFVQNTGAAASCGTPAPNNPGNVVCSFPPLASADSAQFTLTANINPSFTGTLNNTASVTGDNVDPNSGNNSQMASATVSASADLTINKTGPASANAGTDVTYTVTLTNSGPSGASAVSLSDSTPANTTFVSETQTTGPAFSCSKPAVGGTGTISCTIGLFPIGSATFSITLHIGAGTATGTVITNTANVSSTTADPNPSGNTPSANTTVTASPNADLSITKTPAPGPYGTGQQLTYTIVVSNGGPSAAAAVTVTDTLPAGTTLVSSTPAGACSGSPVVTCNAGTITNGGSATFTLTVTLPSTPGPITNTAVVSASAANPDPNPGNNPATSTITVVPAANIPMISPVFLLLLCIALAVAGAFVQKS